MSRALDKISIANSILRELSLSCSDFNSDFIRFGIGKTDFKDVLKGIQQGVEILKWWVHMSSLYSTYPTGEPVDRAFRNTLLHGGFARTQDRHPSDDSFAAWSNFMRKSEADVLKSLLTNSQLVVRS